MNWQIKVLAHWLLPFVPRGKDFHYWLQKRVTKSLPRNEERFLQALAHAQVHVETFNRHSGMNIEEACLYEFGAGDDMLVQLCMYALGAKRQLTVDLHKLLRRELINDSIQRIGQLRSESFLRTPQNLVGREFEADLKEFYGIDYRAPSDARRTGLPTNSVDFITSSETLQVIPREGVVEIIRECHRILKKDGIMSMHISYEDHYRSCDSSLSAYNFLRYSNLSWRFLSPPNHFLNRLRHRDYFRIFQEANFEVLEEEKLEGNRRDLAILQTIPIAPEFKNYSLEELAVRRGHFCLRPKTV